MSKLVHCCIELNLTRILPNGPWFIIIKVHLPRSRRGSMSKDLPHAIKWHFITMAPTNEHNFDVCCLIPLDRQEVQFCNSCPCTQCLLHLISNSQS
ncbi:hypothetical protein L798_11825 [Zootermopsis nevadensis]|uniref:Uncharacterized protein n=1 Tax=Zootermopsis nevadensis TaxID=136037 RepID=A0A067QVK8_ZOONE|nr:hypothetical protein L798_11825 [Zootermopsis nevadensis]